MRLKYRNLYILLWLISATLFGQNDALFIHKDIYQSGNPAYMPKKAFVIGMPLLSNIQMNASTPVRLADVLTEDKANDEWLVDYSKLEDELGTTGAFYTDFNIDLFYAGFRYQQNYFSLSWSYRSFTDAWIPSDLVRLRAGNWDEITNTILQYDIENLAMNTTTYSELKLGWAGEVNDQLRVGAAFKVLTGGVNMQTVKNDWYVNTSEYLYYNKLSGESSMKTSLPIEVTVDEEGNVDDISFDDDKTPFSYMANKNYGLAIDLGLDYKITDQMELSVYVKDLGFMKWKESPYRFSGDYNFLYKGIYVTPESIEDEDFEFFENLADSITDANFTVDSSSYTTFLPQALYINGIYHANDMVSFGGMFKSRFYNERFYPELTLASSVRPSEWFQGSIALGFDRNSTAKVGLGMQFDAGPLQLFMQASNLQGFILDKSKSIGVSFGINFLFAEKRF